MIHRRTFIAGAAAAAVIQPLSARAAALNTVLDAKPFQQTKTMSCWAAAAVILLRWKNGIPFSELDVAKMAGDRYVAAFTANSGLNGPGFADFARSLGLTTEAPQNFTATGYHDLLRAHGPLWIASRLDAGSAASRRHIRVLRGIIGDGTSDGSTAFVLDPDGGGDRTQTVAELAAELEQIAREEIGSGNDLYSQVIRFP